ncbi:Hypothetical predicted protein [Olea europaea subsp. europaea]|uniref:Uncharacterized protein n=1 Tax=Olea europaea subsp. europaea TaxID=158383 RepID=A0A8S0VHF8_OLEEU|nr:Hypothetical predicted protein [Olea europaea subsp. europaea]
MNEIMKQFQQGLIEVETEAENLLLACQPQGLIEVEMEVENLLLARQPLVDNDRVRQGNREVLTALRKRAQTTKTSVPLCFKSVMWYVESRPLVKEHSIPFPAAHTILEKDQAHFDYESKRFQSFAKEKSFSISQKGVLADKISPGVLRGLVTLTDKPK